MSLSYFKYRRKISSRKYCPSDIYAERRYAECRYAECHYAECLRASPEVIQHFKRKFLIFFKRFCEKA